MQMKPLIKILDWGLASLRTPKGIGRADGCTRLAGIVGTADYLSPEQARNANTVDIRSDIYSLGCSFYYLLTGQAPFPDGTLMQKIMQHQTGRTQADRSFRNDVPAGVVAHREAHDGEATGGPLPDAGVGGAGVDAVRARPSLGSGSSSMLPTLRGVQKLTTGRDDTPLPPALKASVSNANDTACAKRNSTAIDPLRNTVGHFRSARHNHSLPTRFTRITKGLPMPRRILVLSASVGAGHLRAAEAVELAARQMLPDATVRNVDVLDMTNASFGTSTASSTSTWSTRPRTPSATSTTCSTSRASPSRRSDSCGSISKSST